MKRGISSPSLERKQARLAKWGGRDKKESRDENLEMKPEIDTAINIPYCIVSVDLFFYFKYLLQQSLIVLSRLFFFSFFFGLDSFPFAFAFALLLAV